MTNSKINSIIINRYIDEGGFEEWKKKYGENIFESIKHIDEYGNEYWFARELQIALTYKRWDKFKNSIEKAMESCKNSNYTIEDHFSQIGKMVIIGSGAKRIQEDYKLSRYACYLIVQRADGKKQIVALGQSYFAIQTRKAELTEEYIKDFDNLSEDEKRLRKRAAIKKNNYDLNQAARDAGVKNFGEFHNAGYKGLYNGETADDIAKRKGLRYREEILDNMGSDELIANEFRIMLAKQKIKNEKIKGEKNASSAHYEVGSIVRNSIKQAGGTMPEYLPTPAKSIKELKKINGGCSNNLI